MLCPACVAENPDEDLFCENCGLKLGDSAPEPVVARCVCGAAAAETDEDGFCLRCGRRAHPSSSPEPARQPQPSDRIEQSFSPDFAAVTDRGLRHAKNEDRFGIFEVNGAQAIVVCDGVSTSSNAEVASAAVSEGALQSLSITLNAPNGLDHAAAVRQAIAAGAAHLAALASAENDRNPPSTTIVAALADRESATIGWLGDSRAYWIDLSGEAPARPLTRDHSWLNAVVGSGEMTPELAAKSPQAHAITRWIGADAGDELEPGNIERTIEPMIDIARHPLPATGGCLLLCTDGLWNYFPTAEAMAAIVREAAKDGRDALAIARHLVDLANRRGGHDNITAAVLIRRPPDSGQTHREENSHDR